MEDLTATTEGNVGLAATAKSSGSMHEHMAKMGYHRLPQAGRATMPKVRMPRMAESRSMNPRY